MDQIACALCEPWKSASSSSGPPELCPPREGVEARQHGLLGTTAALGWLVVSALAEPWEGKRRFPVFPGSQEAEEWEEP